MLGVLALLLAACGLSLPGDEPAPTLFVIPTLTPVPGQAAASQPALEPPPDSAPAAGNPLAGPVGVDSYRVTLELTSLITAPDGTSTTGRILAEGVRQLSPPAAAITFTFEGSADFGQGESMTITQLGGVDYLQAPGGGCVSFAAGETESAYSLLFESGGVLSQLDTARPGVPPVETVNGVQTDHFTFDETALDSTDPTTGGLTGVQGDIYLAQDGGYVVRLAMTGQGVSTLISGTGDVAAVTYELNYSDFGQPVNVALPPECETVAEIEVSYPVLDDAAVVQTAPGQYTYTTARTYLETLDYYQAQMPAGGYTLVEEAIAAPTAALTYQAPDGSLVQINLAPDPAGGVGTLVTVFADS